MSNYTKITDYAAKDLLLHLDPLKAIKGSEVGAEFDAIATMSATKTDAATLAAAGGAALVGNTPAGNISATTVQAALNELDSEKAKVGANADITSMTALTAPTVAANPARATDIQAQTVTAFTTAGTAPNFTLTPVPAPAALTANLRFRVKFHAAGAGSDVINIAGLGNKSLKQYDGSGAKVAPIIALNQLADIEYDGTDLVILNPLSLFTFGYMLLRDERSSGTTGGASAVGNQTRVLNTVVANTISGASLASNQITLPAGTYRLTARAPAIGVNNFQAFLYNVTDAVVTTRGSSENGMANNVSDACQVHSFIEHRMTLAGTKVFEIRMYCNEVHSNGLGAPVSQGTEVYSMVEIVKE